MPFCAKAITNGSVALFNAWGVRAGLRVILVGKADGGTRPLCTQFSHGRRRKADTVLMILDFLEYADSHDFLPAFRINS